MGFLLIRTRIGLIYEVAKMNVLLGLPVGRVRRVNPLSIFFIMHLFISMAGGVSCCLFLFFLYFDAQGQSNQIRFSYCVLAGVGFVVLLILLYVGTVLYTTADKRLQQSTTK